MRNQYSALVYCLWLPLSLVTPLAAQDGRASWPQWRGPLASGFAPDSQPPIDWTATDNVRWKTALPGRGHSTPVSDGKVVFLTTAVPFGEKLPPRKSGRPGAHDNLAVDSRHQFQVLALDFDSGRILWQRIVHESLPLEGGHISASLASASPATDGKHVFAFFGSHGLYCLDMEGKVVWEKQLGEMHTKHGHGEGCSPVLWEDNLIINWDHEEQSFLAVFDSSSGRELWRQQRNEVTSWSTPVVVEHDGVRQVIVAGTDRVRSYNLDTGEDIWECGGMAANIVSSPVYADGVVVVGSSYEKRAMLAIDLKGARGDITDTDHVLWQRSRGTPYVPSLLLAKQGVYFLAHYQNVLSRVDLHSGADAPGQMRLGALGSIYSSPVATNDYIYVTDLAGTTMVITEGAAPRAVAVNQLGEAVSASLAIVGDSLLIRGEDNLFCIGSP